MGTNYPKYVKEIRMGKDNYEYICYVCNRFHYYENSMLINFHLKSKKHNQRMEELKNNFCSTCNLQCRCLSAYEDHLNTKRHKEKASGEYKTKYICEKCNKNCMYKSAYEQHLKTKAHNDHDTPKEELKCEICDVEFFSLKDKIRHLNTKKHAKKVESGLQSTS